MAVVRVICKDLKNNPQCPHGPTLKFVRIQNGSEQEFFACSTFRDRKDCGFYLSAGDKLTEKIKQLWALEKKRVLPQVDHSILEARLNEVKQALPRYRIYCHSCNQLDLESSRDQHHTHDVQSVISDKMLSHPSQILKPKQGSKKEAQYLFSASTTQVIVENLRRAGVTRVLCMGTPRVHETIQALSNSEIDSLLMDLDYRYHSFWPSNKFIWYNMFNRHMLSTNQDIPKRVLKRFLRAGSGRLALVIDPPFGGHVEPLAATVKHFAKLVAKLGHNEQLLVIWIFPYFRERHIKEKCLGLSMLDYKVEYDNHKEFNNGTKGRKLGSPVRLFTNMDAKQFVLPKSEGYRLCQPCARWVSAENKHCAKCKTCPSKDGRTYVHCDKCGSCVKPQWQHCVTCQTCLPRDHDCSSQNHDENTEPRHKKIKSVQSSFKSQNWKKKMKK